MGSDSIRTSPDFNKEQFLAIHRSVPREVLNEYGRAYSDDPLGVGGPQLVKTKGETIEAPYEYTTMVEANELMTRLTSISWCTLL